MPASLTTLGAPRAAAIPIPVPSSERTGAAVVVPVKAFSRAKERLAGVLSPPERADLARRMATTVVAAARHLPVAVVCDDEEVRVWAEAAGAEAIWTPGLGLDGAVEAGVAHLARRGIGRAVVAHADLPLATDLAWLADFDGVTLVPDRRRDGTNAACVPTGAGFRFAYGAASFTRHRAEATRLGLPYRIVADERLSVDVDLPADLRHVEALGCR
ncbi:MAG: 2-phospho-L-lactate guanylyltransferase [Acidimicrobiia bacterium]